MKNLVWSKKAVDDLQAIRSFWIPRDPHLIIALQEQLQDAIRFVTEHPRAGSPTGRTGRRRKWQIGRTPFLLFYSVTSIAVHIGSIRHERENWLRVH